MSFNIFTEAGLRHLTKRQYIYDINILKKYFFALIVFTYLITAAGIPIYLHYCGGELEQISYVVKSNECCGDDVDGDEENGCCKDKDLMLVNDGDFIVKHSDLDLTKTFAQNACIVLLWSSDLRTTPGQAIQKQWPDDSPPDLVQKALVSNSVMRI